MSKAEERALEKYPLEDNSYDVDRIIAARINFVDGYQQAMQDLELTWEDMMIIHRCIKDAMNYHLYKMMEGAEGQKVVYQEVLNRFNNERSK